MATMRPEIKASRHVVSAGHPHASQAAFTMLENGGNAIDAGVAAGLALGVLQSDLVSCAGVAPIILFDAKTEAIITISGLGWWPKAADVEYFRREHGGSIPAGVNRTVVPAAPDAWITALERFGTMTFGEVAEPAIRFARDGFPMNHLLHQTIAEHIPAYSRWQSTADIYLPGGKPVPVGGIFRQTDLGASLQYMADEEAAAKGRGRAGGLQAARDAFYKGDIAAKIVAHHAEAGGWMTREDLADFSVGVEPPVKVRIGDVDVYACGPWCQGPAVPQALRLLDRFDLRGLGHNGADYVHVLTEAIKLVMADRDAWYADPRFFDVPLKALLSNDYADTRAKLIDLAKAWPELPPPGTSDELRPEAPRAAPGRPEPAAVMGPAMDTSYVAVIDDEGNVFSATPSDGSYNGPVTPGTGLAISPRGSQSWTDPDHPSVLEPGKRPRLTPNPALAVQNGERFLAFGTPGGDVQTQAMVQTFLNVFAFGMDTQEAVEAPRFASYSFPSSFEPHDYHPGLLKIEGRIDRSVGDDLASRGHRVEWWPDQIWLAGSISMAMHDRSTGLRTAAADPRRMAYALGW